MSFKKTFVKKFGVGVLCALPIFGVNAASDTIKIGEINSYTRLPAFTEPYRKGWQLAVEEINAAGGVKGKKLEVISRDDAGKPGNAIKIAEELVRKEGVTLLAGTFFSHIGLAVTDFAKQNKEFEIKALCVSGRLLGADQIDVLAKLPTRDQALSILMSVMLAPVTKLTRTINDIPGRVARVVAAVRDQKQSA